MKTIIFLLAALSACASDGLSYEDNDLELVTAYRAKELCSCLFVMRQSEAYCSQWTVANPNIAKFSIDWKRQRVETSAVIMWNASARYVSDRFGCILE